ncbi:hypothetical protein KI387_043912 [Taxus chinensis]|uniref:Uncharacterized protein n=1 Tax=Taxus chinensis TaxID=29808 RepID=A0AA38GJ21_TAXCH|nr:hypothetical protein KI387_043912 [Taxus chinensis]
MVLVVVLPVPVPAPVAVVVSGAVAVLLLVRLPVPVCGAVAEMLLVRLPVPVPAPVAILLVVVPPVPVPEPGLTAPVGHLSVPAQQLATPAVGPLHHPSCTEGREVARPIAAPSACVPSLGVSTRTLPGLCPAIQNVYWIRRSCTRAPLPGW